MSDLKDQWREYDRRKAREGTLERQRGDPPPLPGTGHYTGRCGKCGSSNLWDDNMAYGCNDCDAFWCGFD